MKVMTSPNYPWDDLHHRSYLLPQVMNPSFLSNQYTFETKDFIPSGHINWFKNPIPTLDAFEEGNMANISPTIKMDISCTLGVMENISVGEFFSLTESVNPKHLFEEFRYTFRGLTKRCLDLNLPFPNTISTLGLTLPLSDRSNVLCTQPRPWLLKLKWINYGKKNSFSLFSMSWVSNPIPITKK